MSQTDYTKIRLISAGVKLFGRSELAGPKRNSGDDAGDQPKHQFRVLNEGLLTTLRYIDQASFLVGDSGVLSILLKDYHPRCDSFEEPFKSFIDAAGKELFNGHLMTTLISFLRRWESCRML